MAAVAHQGRIQLLHMYVQYVCTYTHTYVRMYSTYVRTHIRTYVRMRYIQGPIKRGESWTWFTLQKKITSSDELIMNPFTYIERV